jgi:hypothetical protein
MTDSPRSTWLLDDLVNGWIPGFRWGTSVDDVSRSWVGWGA